MKLRVPGNINIRREVWKGLSYADGSKLVAVLILSALCAVIYVTMFNPDAVVWATMFVIVTTGVAFIMLQRIDALSPYEIIKLSLSFHRGQQHYYFIGRDK